VKKRDALAPPSRHVLEPKAFARPFKRSVGDADDPLEHGVGQQGAEEPAFAATEIEDRPRALRLKDG